MRELQSRGAHPYLLRNEASNPSSADRAQRANQIGPEILIVLGLNRHEDAGAEGASTYYYGREGWFSQAGQRLAELIQAELTSQLGLKDGRTHPKSLLLLRETQMPAVQVEPCFITNPEEEARLRDEIFRQRLAMALADGMERYFRLGEASHSTGTDPPRGEVQPRPAGSGRGVSSPG